RSRQHRRQPDGGQRDVYKNAGKNTKRPGHTAPHPVTCRTGDHIQHVGARRDIEQQAGGNEQQILVQFGHGRKKPRIIEGTGSWPLEMNSNPRAVRYHRRSTRPCPPMATNQSVLTPSWRLSSALPRMVGSTALDWLDRNSHLCSQKAS